MADAAHSKSPLSLATAADLRAMPAEPPWWEVVAGEIVQRAAPSGGHGGAQFMFGSLLGSFQRRGGGGGPGGWWFGTEVEIEFETHEVYLPDVVGWRRERVPERPIERTVRIRPDWVCEILSPSTAKRDLTVKRLTYARCGVPHYWVVDVAEESLYVNRLVEGTYQTILTAGPDDRVRAEPFDAIEIQVGLLFGRDPDDL